MKRLLSVFLAFAMVFTMLPAGVLMASAEESGDYYYSVSGTAATITGYKGPGGAIVIPTMLGEYTVTGIGDFAFQGCLGLTGVVIQNGLSVIGDWAFANCADLTDLTIGDSVTNIGASAFTNCSDLTGVTIPNSVVDVGLDAFSYCTGLTSAMIGSGVNDIHALPFYDCKALTEIIVDSGNLSYSSNGGVLFNYAKTTLVRYPEGKVGSYIIPSSVAIIGEYSFYQCMGLSGITIPSSVNTISNSAFEKCPGLTTVRVPNSVSVIGDYAFAFGHGLTGVTLGNNVTDIGAFSFTGCPGLTSVTITSRVTNIGEMAFTDCTSMVSAYFSGDAPTMGSSVFDNCAPAFTVYYLSSSNDFTTPLWYGYPSAVFGDATLVARDGSTAIINQSNHLIYGLEASISKTDFENIFVRINGNGRLVYTPDSESLGTGAKVELVNNTTDAIIGTYFIVIFGDVNGDGSIDSIDAGVAVDFENYIISWDPTKATALNEAGDVNGDDSVDSIDAGVIVDIENYIININQITGLAYSSKITFDSAGGTAVVPITGNVGDAVAAPANPTKVGYTFNGWLPALPATFPAGGLTVTAQWNADTYETGDIIEYGTYPQTKVTDSGLIAALNAQTLQADNTVTYAGSKYQRVYFTQYTPYWTTGAPTAENSYQDDNGYYINTIYWFKFETIKWRVLSSTDGELFVMAEKILDSKAYNQVNTDVTWETCTLRDWLNNDFFNIAFNSSEQSEIILSTVINEDNPWYNTDGGNDTEDNLFLLSFNETNNPAFGFSSNYDTDTAREAKGTDFSKSNGLLLTTDSFYFGNSDWWLRSPGDYQYNAGFIYYGGDVCYSSEGVHFTSGGVRPVFKINLSSASSTITFDCAGGTAVESITGNVGDAFVAPANPTKVGYTFAGWLPALPAAFPEGGLAVTAQWTPINTYVTGDIIEYGSYPQTKVTDAGLITALNAQTLQVDNTVTYAGSKYQRVYFAAAVNQEQAVNGYNINTVYWFKFEPIQWRVLSNTNGELFVMSEKILDSRVYHPDQIDVTWETCTLRNWLNNDFYNTAFNSTEQAGIITSAVVNEDNSAYGTEGGNNTSDKLFLLSYAEEMNPAYGFSSESFSSDTARRAQGTDFSKCNGLYVSTDSSYLGNGNWWLRSPGQTSRDAYRVYYDGSAWSYIVVNYIAHGTRPVFKINLSSASATITFDSAGGTAVAPLTGNVGDVVAAPANPTKAGYTFSGWLPALPAAFPEGGLAVTAQWTPINYTITFNANGGTGGTTPSVAYGTMPTAPVVTRVGYTFASWSPAIVAVTGAATYMAQWTPVNYTITFNANGGTGGTTPSVAYGTMPTTPVVTRVGYTFASWSPAIVAVTGAATYMAQWTPINTYVTGDIIEYGSYPQTNVTDLGLIAALNAQTLQADNTVTYAGSKYQRVYFASEVNQEQAINGYNINTVYWFKFEPIKWRVLYNTEGELFVMAEKILESRPYNQVNTNVTWETCNLRNWLNNDFYNTAFNSTEQAKICLSVVFNEDHPLYETDGGNNTSDKLFLLSYSETINPAFGFSSIYNTEDTARMVQGTDFSKCNGLYTSTDIAHLANGFWWLRSPGGYQGSAGIVYNDGIVYYGSVNGTNIGVRPALKINLSSALSTITFDSAGGSAVAPLNGNVGDAVVVPANPTKVGYTFSGWLPALPAAFPEGGLAVTAQWTPINYTITFNANGGIGGTTPSVAYGTMPTAPVVTRVGYTFERWSPAIAAVKGAATYMAQWTENTYGTGDIIEYGSYPQTKVTDAGLITTLNAQTLQADNTVTYAGSKYQRVYFTQYTPAETLAAPTAENSYQDDNGYFINTVYWFKFEPIQWRVLYNTGTELFVMAEKILDSKAYNQDYTSVTWETSPLRNWLNNDFYNTAFNSTEQAGIKLSTVVNEDNPDYGMEGGNNTSDKLFLLSYAEISTPAYGFSSNFSNQDTARITQGTDFSKGNGLSVLTDITYLEYSNWWLRSPGFELKRAGIVGGEGIVYSSGYPVDWTLVGVRPAFKIDL